jgi:hypothetical protein
MFTHLINIYAMQGAARHQQETIKWFENERLANQTLPEPKHNHLLTSKMRYWLKCWIARWKWQLMHQDRGKCWQAAEECC